MALDSNPTIEVPGIGTLNITEVDPFPVRQYKKELKMASNGYTDIKKMPIPITGWKVKILSDEVLDMEALNNIENETIRVMSLSNQKSFILLNATVEEGGVVDFGEGCYELSFTAASSRKI